MGGEIGKYVYEFGEKALSKLEPAMTKFAQKSDAAVGGKLGPGYVAGVTKKYSELAADAEKQMSKGFTLGSILPRDGSKSGAALHGMYDDYVRSTSRDLHTITQDNAANGIKMSAGDLAKAARGGHTLSNGQKLTGAYEGTFNKRSANLTGVVEWIAKEHGHEKAQNVVDALGVAFHEEMRDYGSGSYGTRLLSDLKAYPGTKDIKFRPSEFQERGPMEKAITTGASTALTFKSGLRHLSTPMNMMIGVSLSNLTKTLNHAFGAGYKDAKAQLQLFGVLGEISAREADQAYKFENGLISKFIPGTPGRFIHDNFQMPFFDAIRHWTMTVASAQGRDIAEESAANLMSGDPKLIKAAEVELRYLGINPHDVINRGGMLSHQEIGNAMFENANQRVFIDTSRSRSRFTTSTFMGRMWGMYHNYAAQEVNFIARQLKKDYAKGDYGGMLKNMAILGTVFPAVGAGLNAGAELWMGKSPKDIKEELSETFDPHHINFWKRVEAFSHTAGLGVMNSYMRATARNKLANAMLGPVVNTGVELAQDTYKAAAGIGKKTKPGHVKTWEPLARDLLHDIPSMGIGGIIAAHAFPTQQQLNAAQPLTAKKIAAKRAAEKRKLLGR